MILPMKVGVAGQYRVFVLDEFGNIERGRGGVPVARDESGFIRKVGAWRPNLVTDNGLDEIASEQWARAGSSHARHHLHVGDGSTAPANGDTLLASQIATTTADGGFSEAYFTPAVDGSDLVLKGRVTRIYTASGAQNVREFGLSPDGVAGNLVVRELVRDEADNPITLSLLSGKKFRLDHTGEMRIPLETTIASLDMVEYDAGGSVATTRSFVNAKIWPVTDTSFALYGQTLEPDQSVTPQTKLVASQSVVAAAPTPTSSWAIPGTKEVNGVAAPNPAYVPGSFQVERGGRFSESVGNAGSWATFAVGQVSGTTMLAGYVIALQDGTHPKDNVHLLDVFLRFTLARV